MTDENMVAEPELVFCSSGKNYYLAGEYEGESSIQMGLKILSAATRMEYGLESFNGALKRIIDCSEGSVLSLNEMLSVVSVTLDDAFSESNPVMSLLDGKVFRGNVYSTDVVCDVSDNSVVEEFLNNLIALVKSQIVAKLKRLADNHPIDEELKSQIDEMPVQTNEIINDPVVDRFTSLALIAVRLNRNSFRVYGLILDEVVPFTDEEIALVESGEKLPVKEKHPSIALTDMVCQEIFDMFGKVALKNA